MSAESVNGQQESVRLRSSGKLTPVPGSIVDRGHILALDGLRGIAILLVLVFHFAPYAPGLHVPTVLLDRLYLRVSEIGWTGVDLFFVLSGYLITRILYDTKGSKHYFRQFYVRRFLRIVPLYYVALALFLIVLPLPHSFDWIRKDLRADAVWYWTFLYNMRVAGTGFLPSGALQHFWSLAVEEQFYLIWPIVVLWLGRKHLIATCAVAIVAALAYRLALSSTGYVALPDVWMPARMDGLAVGALIALMARVPTGLALLRRWATPVAVAAALPLAILLRYNVALSTVAHTLTALLFGAILVLCLPVTPRSSLATGAASPILRFFGRYSYALYVFHNPLLWFRPVFSLAFIPTVFGSQLPAYLLWLAISIGATVAVAVVSWHLLEKPFLKMKKFFPYHSADTLPSTRRIASEPLAFPGLVNS
jgi:peptidoglycan/LPS O-acetylase OafA/YrhL